MENRNLKIILICICSLLILSSAQSKILFQRDPDYGPGKKGESREVINVALNVGRIIGSIVLFVDDDLMAVQPANRTVKSFRSETRTHVPNNTMAIIFGSIALFFLIINMYFGGKIVEFLKSRGKKAHYYALRWMIFSYVNQYKSITTEEDGQTGPYYRPIGISAALFVVFIGIAIYFAAIA